MRAWRLLAVGVIALTACNAIVGFEELHTVTKRSAKAKEGGEDPETVGEAGAKGLPDGGRRCDPAKNFDIPELIVEFDGDKITHSAVMTADELEVFYMQGDATFRHGRRPTRDAPWKIETKAIDPPPEAALSISAGGLRLYYWTTLDGSKKVTRSTTAADFGPPENFLTPKSNAVFVVASDDQAYYVEQIDGGEQAIKVSDSANYGVSGGGLVPNVGFPKSRASYPVLNVSQTALYFTSNREAGNFDVFVAHRPTRNDDFSQATHVRGLTTGAFDQVTWVSDDDCEVLLDRASHVYRARKPL